MAYQVQVNKMIEEDNFEKGCIGNISDFGKTETYEFSSIEKIMEVCKMYGDNPIILDNRITTDRLENREGDEATKSQIEQWKLGKCKLWLARYDFYISEVKRTDIENEELSKLFPTLEHY